MASVEWMMQGPGIVTCNCKWGCPCRFNALPTHGKCRAGLAMRIDKGHFGKTKLDGLPWAVLAAWPKAIHMGNGELLPIVDERANPEQRTALLMSGQETEPFATFFAVVTLPHGSEYHSAEYASSRTRATGKIALDWSAGHAHLAMLHLTQKGPVH